LSNNSTFDGSDILLGQRPVPALGPGVTSSATTAQLNLPQGTPTGTYYVIARADGTNAIVERSETNNNRSASFKVGPDLIVSGISAATAGVAGANITVNNAVKNQGSGSAGAFTVRFYRSTNTIFDGSDIPLGSRVITSLGRGASNAAATSLPIPSNTAPGTYFILAVVDADFQITEATENNNVRASGFINVGPGPG
jgi:subtilase family serine protease